MGDVNQLLFIRQHAEPLEGPYLEVGSKDYGSTQDLRSMFADKDRYLGVDVEHGPGVDILLDLTEPFEQIDARFDGTRFGTIFCLSVLEHCRQPFVMAENLTRLLRPGGRICISVPFAWKLHGYASDYWRFTHEGVEKLFAKLVFDPQQCVWATSRRGDFRPLNPQLGKIPFGTKPYWRKGQWLRGLSAKVLKLLAKIGMLRWLAGYPYVLAPTNVLMIGRLREE